MPATEPDHLSYVARLGPMRLVALDTIRPGAIGIPEPERRALGAIVARHRQVHRIVSGHVHSAVIGDIKGTSVLAVPSTDVQLVLDLNADSSRFEPATPGFALHLLVGGRIVSHLQPIR
jgi:hypothetical protein